MPIEKNSFVADKFAIDNLLRESWEYRTSDEFVRFFNFIARFNHYSRYNTMLVYIQNPSVTFWAGQSYWKKKFGRTIKENARPYIILAPNGPVMLVYDLFETEGSESPEEFLERGMGRPPLDVVGYLDVEIFRHAVDVTEKWGIKVTYRPLSYFKGGYITTILKGYLEICLKQGMSNEKNFAVLIHELGHLFLGHTGHEQVSHEVDKKTMNLWQRKLPRTTEELEAETVCYLICHKLGLEKRSAEYIAGYIKNENDLIQFSYENVIKTADKIEKMFIKQG